MEDLWNHFKLRINVNASIGEVYKAWTTQAGLESWFLRKALFAGSDGKNREPNTPVAEGDSYTWYWHGYPDSVLEKGKVLKANGKDHFVFTFSMNCPVTISIYQEAGETMVELVESELPTDLETIRKHFVGDSGGWVFYLANLKSVLEGGLDLRNKKLELTNVINS